MDAKDLPDDIKDQLIEIAENELDTEKQQISFCRSAGKRIAETAQSFFTEYENTIVYTAIAAVLGFGLAQCVRAIPWVGPFLGPVADVAALVFTAKCGFEGYRKDCDNAKAKRDQERLLVNIRDIVADELKKARLAPNT